MEDIPTPDEINRVTLYLQSQAAEAQETIIAAKQAAADQAQAAATDLVQNNNVVGVSIERRAFDDETIPWQKKGDITSIRLDFEDGAQTLVQVGEAGDSLELSMTPGNTASAPQASAG
jgi:hypothetical protein